MIVIEGTGSRPSHHGDGYRESEEMYTLNTTEIHGVCYKKGDVIGLDGQNGLLTGDQCCTLMCGRTDYKNVPSVIILHHHIPGVTGISPDQSNIQTLIARAGTGGGNVPLIMQKVDEDGKV